MSGCSDEPVDLGEGLLVVDRSALSSYANVWTGYLEARTFDSGSDSVRLSLDEEGNGFVVFGEGTPPPLPTDADNPWNEVLPGETDPLNFTSVFEGLSYPISGSRVDRERITFQAEADLHLETACALQTPVGILDENGHTGCLPNVAARQTDDGQCFLADESSPSGPDYPHQVSCAKLQLCRIAPCQCNATDCYNVYGADNIVFDAALDEEGTRLVGTLLNVTVRLQREP